MTASVLKTGSYLFFVMSSAWKNHSSKPVVGQNTVDDASPTTRNVFLVLISTIPVHSHSFLSEFSHYFLNWCQIKKLNGYIQQFRSMAVPIQRWDTIVSPDRWHTTSHQIDGNAYTIVSSDRRQCIYRGGTPQFHQTDGSAYIEVGHHSSTRSMTVPIWRWDIIVSPDRRQCFYIEVGHYSFTRSMVMHLQR